MDCPHKRYLQYDEDAEANNVKTDPECVYVNTFSLYPPRWQLFISVVQGFLFSVIGAAFLVKMASRFIVGILPLLLLETLSLASFICIHVGLYKLLILLESKDGQNIRSFGRYWKLFALGDIFSTMFQLMAMFLASFLHFACGNASWQPHFKAFFEEENGCVEFQYLLPAEMVLGLLLILLNILRPLFYRYSCLWTIYEKTYRHPLKWLVCGLFADVGLATLMVVLRDLLSEGPMGTVLALLLLQIVLTVIRWSIWVSTTDQTLMEGAIAWTSVLVYVAVYVNWPSGIIALATATAAVRAWLTSAEAMERFQKCGSGVKLILFVLMIIPQCVILFLVNRAADSYKTDGDYSKHVGLSQLALQSVALVCNSLLYCEIAIKWEPGHRPYLMQGKDGSWSYYAQVVTQVILVHSKPTGVGGQRGLNHRQQECRWG